MSKIGLHIQSATQYAINFPALYVKMIDPPETNPFPGKRVIARYYMPDGDSNALIRQGAAGADQWWTWVKARRRAYAWADEAPNEPQPMSDPSFRVKLDEFTYRLAEIYTANGLKLVGMNWSVGWPDIGHAPEFRASLAKLAQGGHYLGLHEYSAPSMMDGGGWLTLRYRKTFAELRAQNIPIPKTFIGETGIDGGVLNPPMTKSGWQVFTNEDGYLSQLKWYDGELKKDSEIVAAFVFTCCLWDWFTFHITEPLCDKLATYVANDITIDPIPQVREKGIDVSQYQGVIDWQQVAASGIQFAFIRASVCRSDGTLAKDPYFDANWAGARAVGIKRGAYHYLHESGTGQALFFVQAVGSDKPELGYWADVEDASLSLDKVEGFLAAVDRNAGEVCGVYTRASYFDKFGIPEWAKNHSLWVAHYYVAEPTIPKAWDTWDYWQYSSTGSVPGISGNVDLNWSCGPIVEIPEEEPEEEPVSVKVIDKFGVEQTWDWVQAKYGNVQISDLAGDGYVVTHLIETGGVTIFTATVLGARGGPVVGQQVAYIWPDGRQVHVTNGSGVAEHQAGSGEMYDPTDGGTGPITWQVEGQPGQVVSGLGMPWGTDHDKLNPIFLWDSEEEEDPEEDGDIVDALYAIASVLMDIRDKLPAGWQITPLV